MRILGIILMLLSVCYGVLNVVIISETGKMGGAVATDSRTTGASVEVDNWKMSAVVSLVFCGACFVAGMGMLARRRWAVGMLAVTATLLLLFDLVQQGSGWVTHRFEATGLIELAVLAIVVAGLWMAHLRIWRRSVEGEPVT